MSKNDPERNRHKACTCLACSNIGTKAAIATDAVQDLASDNARLRADLEAALAMIERLKSHIQTSAEMKELAGDKSNREAREP